MKKTIFPLVSALFILLFLFRSQDVHAQKSAFVDTQYILNNIPEYTDAQDELNELSTKWQKQIAALHQQVSEMYKKYQAESVLLPADVKKKREDAIVAKDNEVKELQKKYFGPGGELFKKREELIKPIQEKVYNAIQTVATTENIAFVFDKAGSPTLLYGNPKYDISDAVLDELGKVMQTNHAGNGR
ncbi:OmpH family outer membrane protein [Candidatus Sulfidibacterium hydrothermale]|uniref:OmpH family outer membrane protein n=1 Tax=Candidatus Sulfidibacterium hydrothermale TaxID=2875962 RepID=UPI001F0B51B0|nr:OmpH family outer membrane protein [Candidatus Sulfidibacterium hydrothermale]UBM62070.1 OmpH family outer membrane protein [Candidatus Sulfidibacterium hydrothermale]